MNGWQIFVELTGRPPVEIRPGESLVGRSRTCQVHIPETTVSRQHARILSSALGDVTVEDLGSSNGTFVNGEKIEGRRKLADGDRILVGDAEMRMRIVAPVAATEATVRLTLPPLSQIAAAGAPPPMPAMPAPAPIASSLPADDLDPWEKTPPAPLELPLEPPPAPRPAPPVPMAPPPAASVAETVFAPSPRPGAPPPMAPPSMAPSPMPPRPMAPRPMTPPPPPSVAETVFAPSPRPGAPPMAAPPPLAAPPASVAETVFAPAPRPGAPPPMAAPPPALVPPPPRPAPLPMAVPPPPPAAPVAATVAGAPRVMAAPPAPPRPIDPPLHAAPATAPPRPASAAPPARKDALGSVTVIDRIPIPEPPPGVLEAAKLERARPAGFWIRVAAALIDSIPSIVVMVIGTVLGFVIDPRIPLLTNLIVLPYAFYVGLYMPAMQGTTIGKKMLGLRIVHPNVKSGAGLGWGIALLRIVGHMVCGFTLGFGYLLVAFTSQKQGLHDLIASTRVVRVR